MSTTATVPYELLVRWREGVFSGAHVGWSLLITEDDGTKREIPQGVDPVDIGQGKGFPLADILDKIHVDALVAVAAKDVELSAKEAAIAAAESEKAALAAAKDAEIAAADAARAAKEAEASQLAEAVAAKDAELAFLKLPETEQKKAKIREEIERLQAELEA